MKSQKIPFLYLVCAVSVLIAGLFLSACWNMNWWPTDEKYYYYEAAKMVPSLQYLSQMNEAFDEDRVKWMHGKELFALTISFVQGILNDTQTIRPLLVVSVISIFLSSILVFVVSRIFWGAGVGLLTWFLFSASFWPYLYVLFTKHQTQGLCLFLLSVFFLLATALNRWRYLFVILSGMYMGASLFSSTVSTLYFPYILGVLIWIKAAQKRGLVDFLADIFLFGAGFAAIFIWVNYPDVIGNIKGYLSYVSISGEFNHFFYNQPPLQQWIPGYDLQYTRSGWLWIVQYFFLIMPVLFPLYLVSVGFLLREAVVRKDPALRWNTGLMVLLSFSSPILAEIKGVAQYGANYFTVFIGIIMLVGYAFYVLLNSPWWQGLRAQAKEVCRKALILVLMVHLGTSVYILATDLYPARMATTLISESIKKHKIDRLYTYINHTLRFNMVDQLNPEVLEKLSVVPIQSVIQATDGYILVPPASLDTLYRAMVSHYNDFDSDLVLNEIIRQGKLKDYAVGSFKTVGSSPYWGQEEEILAYRYLVLDQFPKDLDRTKAWLIDGRKFKQKPVLPRQEDVFLLNNSIENIGTSAKVYMYEGRMLDFKEPAVLKAVAARMYKVGGPNDSLFASIYKLEDHQPVWIPVSRGFMSRKVKAEGVSSDPQGQTVVFEFEQPLTVQPGPHYVVIYRTGNASDQDFYRIYKEFLGTVKSH